jgi:hypothetical protein
MTATPWTPGPLPPPKSEPFNLADWIAYRHATATQGGR